MKPWALSLAALLSACGGVESPEPVYVRWATACPAADPETGVQCYGDAVTWEIDAANVITCEWACAEHMGEVARWRFTFEPEAQAGCWELRKKAATPCDG